MPSTLRQPSHLWMHLGLMLLAAGCTKFTPKPAPDTLDPTQCVPCASHEECADLDAPDCKERACDFLSGCCSFPTRERSCFVDNTCYPSRGTPTDDACLECRPEVDQASLLAKECGPGEQCQPDTGNCLLVDDLGPVDACEGDGCSDSPTCGLIECCVDDTECPAAPGVCSEIKCFQGGCAESVLGGNCLPRLKADQGCAICAVPALTSPESWDPVNPDSEPSGWRILDNPRRAVFSQEENNHGKVAELVGPMFAVSAACDGGDLLVQVEHSGNVDRAVPHVMVRARDSLDWLDFQALEFPDAVVDAPVYTTKSIPAGTVSNRLQVSLRSELSAISNAGEATIHRVCVATQSPPRWIEELGTIAAPSGRTTVRFARAEDTDSTELFYSDAEAPSFVEVDTEASDDLGNSGVRLSITPGFDDVGTWTTTLDVRDAAGGGGRVARLVAVIEVAHTGECGDGLLDPGEECDLGEPPSLQLCAIDCSSATDIPVPQGIAGNQTTPFLAMLRAAEERILAVWSSDHGTALDHDVRFRTIITRPASGQPPFGTELQANAHATGHQYRARAAAIAPNAFVVVWQSDVDDATHADGRRSEIRMRLFDGDGANPQPAADDGAPHPDDAEGEERDHIAPDVTRLDDTHAAVAWISQETATAGGALDKVMLSVVAQATFDTVPTPTTVAGTPGISRDEARILAREDGTAIVLAWRERDAASSQRIVYTVLGPNGVQVLRPATPVRAATTAGARKPALAALGDGAFIVAWEETATGDGTAANVRFRLFDSNGNELGLPETANATLLDDQRAPAVTVAATGEIMFAWHGKTAQTGGFDIVTRIGPVGETPGTADIAVALLGERRVNGFPTNDQKDPSILGLADGRFAVAWQSEEQDGSGSGIFIRLGRFAGASTSSE